MERERQDEIVVRGIEQLAEAGAEPGGQRQLVAILERLDQAVDREFVAKQRQRPREGRRVLEAGAATLAERRFLTALRAKGGGERREIGRAGRAQQAAGAVGSTQQATAR